MVNILIVFICYCRKNIPFDDLDSEDKISLALVLLKQLQPYLSANNLATEAPQGLQASTSPRKPMQPLTQDDIRRQADEMLRANGAAGTSQDVDALNGILDNIHVQTKPNQSLFSN